MWKDTEKRKKRVGKMKVLVLRWDKEKVNIGVSPWCSGGDESTGKSRRYKGIDGGKYQRNDGKYKNGRIVFVTAGNAQKRSPKWMACLWRIAT